jgi:hypothetical protein
MHMFLLLIILPRALGVNSRIIIHLLVVTQICNTPNMGQLKKFNFGSSWLIASNFLSYVVIVSSCRHDNEVNSPSPYLTFKTIH